MIYPLIGATNSEKEKSLSCRKISSFTLNLVKMISENSNIEYLFSWVKMNYYTLRLEQCHMELFEKDILI